MLNTNLLINPKKEREREREKKKENPSTTEARGIIHSRTKSFLKLGEHPSRNPGLPALTRKLINGPGPIHTPFFPRQLKSGSKKGRDRPSRTQSRSNRGWLVTSSSLSPLCIGNCLRRGWDHGGKERGGRAKGAHYRGKRERKNWIVTEARYKRDPSLNRLHPPLPPVTQDFPRCTAFPCHLFNRSPGNLGNLEPPPSGGVNEVV